MGQGMGRTMGVKRVPAIISVGSVILDGRTWVFGDRAWDGTTSIVVVVLDHSCIKDVRGSDRDEEAGAEAHGGKTFAVGAPSAVAIILFRPTPLFPRYLSITRVHPERACLRTHRVIESLSPDSSEQCITTLGSTAGRKGSSGEGGVCVAKRGTASNGGRRPALKGLGSAPRAALPSGSGN